jgi:hypothetical protein
MSFSVTGWQWADIAKAAVTSAGAAEITSLANDARVKGAKVNAELGHVRRDFPLSSFTLLPSAQSRSHAR